MGRIHRHEIRPVLIAVDAHVDDAGRGEPPIYSHFLTAPRHTYFFPFGGLLAESTPGDVPVMVVVVVVRCW